MNGKNYLRGILKLLFMFSGFLMYSQPPMFKIPAYVNVYGEMAKEEMTEFGIPASVKLAQAILESNSGTSTLAKRSNNHFGIKCHLAWTGDTIVKTDDTLNECFRSYTNVEGSYRDHSLFLKSRARYASLFNLKITDYRSWCKGLKASGYATYPWYAEELIEIIEKNELYLFDSAEKLESGLKYFRVNDICMNSIHQEYTKEVRSAFSQFLFIDEKDVPIQSLELVVGDDERSEDFSLN